MRITAVIAGIICLGCVAGCATTGRSGSENQALRDQVASLQAQLQEKDAEMESMRSALSQQTESNYYAARAARGGSAGAPSVKQIQLALRNAGYNPGPVDGRMGKMTRSAIRGFQKDNGLSADGKVGKRTWALLEPYLDTGGK